MGREIAKARYELGLTQREVASRSGVSLATVQNIEKGRANPAVGTLARIAGALGLAADVAARPADWDRLAALGVPLAAASRIRTSASSAALVMHLRRALRELQAGRDAAGAQRRGEAVQAALAALHGHFPSFYREHFGRSPLARAMLARAATGRVIKLARLARASFAEYL